MLNLGDRWHLVKMLNIRAPLKQGNMHAKWTTDSKKPLGTGIIISVAKPIYNDS